MTEQHLNQCSHLFTHIPEWARAETKQRTAESENMRSREIIRRSKRQSIAGFRPEGTEKTGYALEFDITAPATDAAKQWQGWGTALKPAHEPIVLARKPLQGTVANNVLTHGTGGLNIDGCRVEGDRWPPNFIHDGSEEATAGLPGGSAKYFYCPKASKADRNEGVTGPEATPGEATGGREEGSDGLNSPRAGAGRTSGGKNIHPTVKPTALMRWLCRLVTPPGGLVLDLFAGSGSTGKAAVLEGFSFIGFEMDPEYSRIANERIMFALSKISG